MTDAMIVLTGPPKVPINEPWAKIPVEATLKTNVWHIGPYCIDVPRTVKVSGFFLMINGKRKGWQRLGLIKQKGKCDLHGITTNGRLYHA